MAGLAKLGWVLALAFAPCARAAMPEAPHGGPGAEARVFAVMPVPAARVAGPPAGLGAAAGDGALAGLRGGSDTPWSDIKLHGAVSGNSAVAVASGANVITEGAFSNASGMPMVIQNSGANVLIQNATIVNVQFK